MTPSERSPGDGVSRETPSPDPSSPPSRDSDPRAAEHVPPAETLPEWLRPARAGLVAYARLLAGDGVERGLIGPREVPRLWERHLLNCAVVADPAAGLVPPSAAVVDVGSGAGLPGLVWALVRPDLRVELVEPLLRRATFLEEAVAALDVATSHGPDPRFADRVRVSRARAEELAGGPGATVVTARAVAPLDRLAAWTLPLARPGGVLLALKGASAGQELEAAAATLRAGGVTTLDVVRCGDGVVDPPTTVVRAVLGARGWSPPAGRSRRGGRSGGTPRNRPGASRTTP